MTNAIRTPDEILIGLPDFPYEPHFREFDGLRLAHLDEGEGPPVWFMHGEPTWSFLWRKVFAPVVDAGFRAIVPDLPGFGRSDKPTDIRWYTYERHYDAMAALLDELDLRGATMVVHDWGGPIGLRLAVDQRERFDRLVILDTGLATGHWQMNDLWLAFRDFVRATEDLPIGRVVRGGCHADPGKEVLAAYDAPYVNAASKAGARAFPELLPTGPDDPGAQTGRRLIAALREDDRPTLSLWGAQDPVLPVELGRAFTAAIGRDPPEIVEDAGHYLQEDKGEEIGRRIAEWLTS
ncbi:MAG: haloalkane dehalogenase [Solirubrobacteraceae bacterium]